MDVKKRFKLYKSGKRWVALALLFGGTAFFIETNQTVANADESVAQTSVQSEPDNSLQVQTEDKQESADQKDSSEAKQPVQSDSQQSTSAEETQEKAATTEETEKAASQSTPKAAEQATVSTPTEQTLSQKNNPAVTTQPKKTGFQKSQDEKKTYYYDGSGNMVHGQQNINGKWYLFDEQTGEMKTGFQYISSQKKKVYYSNAGQMQYGQQHIDRYWYLFDKNTGAMAKGLKWIGDQKKIVYYDGNGQMQYGFKDISGHRYYFDTLTGKMTIGERKIGNDWYLFDQNGFMKTGFQWVSSQKKTAYYDKQTGHRLKGMQKIDGNLYHFDENTGAMTTSQIAYDKGTKKLYLFDNHGHVEYAAHGYSIDKTTGALAYKGVVELNGNHYYFDNNDQIHVGFLKVGRNTQYFDQTTAKRATGQKNVNGSWYLFDGNGNMKYGFQWISNQKKTVYYDLNGQMQYGQQYLSGYWYLFHMNTGAMLTGIQDLTPYGQKKKCLYAGNGRMQYGQKNYRGHWYLFDRRTGAMQTGFKDLKSYGQNKVVYYADNGQMQYRWQVIGHDQYYFDASSGARYAGRRKIGNRWYSFNGNGTLKCFTARVLNWFFNRRGKLTYSMYGSRTGADGTADCSGSMVAALRGAGASRPAYTYNTESIHPYLKSNGYYLAREGRDGNYVPRYGDIVIWGKKGYSGGGGGHIMIMSSAGSDAKCISTCGYYWDKNPNSIYGARGKAVQEFNYKWYHGTHNCAYYYVYRPYDLRRS